MDKQLPKYTIVADWLKQNIKNNTFKVGDKLISENQICSKFDVSRQTARQAVAVLEREDLVVKRQGSGTYVKGPLAKPQHKNIGILTTYIGDYIFPGLISGIQDVLSRHDYQMTLRLTQNKIENERRQLQSLLSLDIDGLIVEATKSALPSPNLNLYQEFIRHNIPIIFVHSFPLGLSYNYIINDDEKGGRLAARHLIENGHKKIGGIFKYDDMQGNLRYKGAVMEMYAHDIPLDENAIIWYSTETHNQLFDKNFLTHTMARLASCTALICYNDEIAIAALQSFEQEGAARIPEDLSVVSFDNSNLAKIAQPALTSVTHPGAQLGKIATESLLATIQNPYYEIKHVFDPQLIVRNSVRKLS
ncbi:MAG: GntR family transcriptional regulator [Clostridiales bacterium]|nr:GntR family transcriptional regulator [Clostridiales bacterium]